MPEKTGGWLEQHTPLDRFAAESVNFTNAYADGLPTIPMRRVFSLVFALVLSAFGGPAAAQDLQAILQTHAEEVAEPGRRTVGVVLDDLLASGLPGVPEFLTRWQDREVLLNTEDGNTEGL